MKSFAAHLKRVTLAAVSLSLLLMFAGAHAAGTQANTSISNTAKVDYQVGGVSQPTMSSNPAMFVVDRKVNMVVAAGSATTTGPGLNGIALAYTVANTGNDNDNFTITAANLTGDDFDVTGIQIYRDVNNDGAFTSGTDTLVSAPVAFTPDQTIGFLIVSNIPNGQTNGQKALMKLTATTSYTQTAGADTAGVDTVFADTGHDGTENATNQYNIASAALAVVKSAAVTWDPVNLTVNPKAIPGAIIEYTMAVTNTGPVAATAVSLSDTIPVKTTYVANSMKLAGASLTDGADADAGTTTGSPTVTSITVNLGTVPANTVTPVVVKFQVTVN